ncbi:FMN-binding protein [Aneurinibacillus sp. Ricciae_BoGa-3]|uniref:FMN-binding protein n=1 Tax=Aneurinibacillus sp. Ricciae_BoGa-3 TaxID=3022697 RepID=UPI00233FEDE7|nr:FMN-binding protein [Aneurinibacillus sp. Ricciae_BoGa-3]WCK54566.1 FMN-binding protein [Aneurinibacillus sp. Ricciae_BoGa-3]
MSANKNHNGNKMSNRLIAVCSVAVGVIYTSGYVVTELHTKEVTAINQKITGASSVQPETVPAASSIGSSGTKAKYRDGTYHGQGSNHIGSIEVAVSIKNGKISTVEITNCTTSYPESYVSDLPRQVVGRQSSNVDVVSGATRSTEDFQAAVDEALQQAMSG